MIGLDCVSFAYGEGDKQKVALKEVTFSFSRDEFIAVIGPNGSGKSTLARLMNGLLLPDKGDVRVELLSTSDHINNTEIKKLVGMLFQNPENQIVGSTVIDDIAFGLENLGVPREEMQLRVKESLSLVGLTGMETAIPHYLSGGQKQRLALAGVLAMQPQYLVLDEPTTMLDPLGKEEIRRQILELCKSKKIGLLWVTHSMEEAVLADRIIVLKNSRIMRDAPPKEVFADTELLKECSLIAPAITVLASELVLAGLPIPLPLLTSEELANVLIRYCS